MNREQAIHDLTMLYLEKMTVWAPSSPGGMMVAKMPITPEALAANYKRVSAQIAKAL